MANRFKVGDRVYVLPGKVVANRDGRDLSRDRAYTISMTDADHTVRLLEEGDWWFGTHNFGLVTTPSQTLTAEDGTKHNAVALSIVLAVIDKIAKEWSSIQGECDPDCARNDIQRIRTGVCELFGHAGDADET